jgi:RNA polymerase sigma-70 factor, ECF subfamily
MSATVTVPRLTNNFLPDDLEELFREHCEFVCRTALRITGSAEDAEDILQTIFLRLIRRQVLPDLQRNPKAYLHRAAVNLSLDKLRSRKTQPVAIDIEHVSKTLRAPESNCEEEVLYQRLYAAIAELRPGAAEILTLRHIHNLSDSEIGELLGKSRLVVAVSLSRSRARLRKIIRASMGKNT